MSDTISLLRKITTKDMGFTTPKIRKALNDSKGEPVHLYNIAGSAHKYEIIDTSYGDSTRFSGEFAAFIPDNPQNVKRASRCFLPEPIGSMLESAMTRTETDDQGNKKTVFVPQDFAVEVWVKSNDTQVGYEYDTRPVVKVTESDAVSGLLEKFNNAPENKGTTESPKTNAKKK